MNRDILSGNGKFKSMKRSQRGLQREEGGKKLQTEWEFWKKGWEFAISNDHGALKYQFLC